MQQISSDPFFGEENLIKEGSIWKLKRFVVIQRELLALNQGLLIVFWEG